jgi:hypothetical protein
LKEAKENSEKLANIADEIANAKESTDAIVEELQDAYEFLLTSVAEREIAML